MEQEQTRSKWANVREKVAALRAKIREQQTLLEQLELWCVVGEAGIDPEQVARFGYRAHEVTRSDLRRCGVASKMQTTERTVEQLTGYVNVVYLKDGTEASIPLTRDVKG